MMLLPSRMFQSVVVLLLSVATLVLLPLHTQAGLFKAKTPSLVIEGASQSHPDVQSLLLTLKAMELKANQHDLDAYMGFYASDFKSGDNLTYTQIKDLIKETWELYPTINYTSRILQLRMNGSWATAETLDVSVAKQVPSPLVPSNAPKEQQVLNQGTMLTKARNQLFFQKRGATWWVVSDHTIYEEAELVFGRVLDVPFSFEAPDQVFAGNSYTARVTLDLPPNVLGIATINREPIQYPHGKVTDQFRPIYPSQKRLERVFDANTTHRNEMVSATIGFLSTSSSGANPMELMLDIQGFRTIVKRINVSPKSDGPSPIAPNGLTVKHIVNYTAKQGKPPVELKLEPKTEATNESTVAKPPTTPTVPTPPATVSP